MQEDTTYYRVRASDGGEVKVQKTVSASVHDFSVLYGATTYRTTTPANRDLASRCHCGAIYREGDQRGHHDAEERCADWSWLW